MTLTVFLQRAGFDKKFLIDVIAVANKHIDELAQHASCSEIKALAESIEKCKKAVDAIPDPTENEKKFKGHMVRHGTSINDLAKLVEKMLEEISLVLKWKLRRKRSCELPGTSLLSTHC
jgi:galactose-1-phosphate uridylyltransferase